MYGKGYLLLRRYITPPKQVIKNTKPLACGAGAHSTFTLLISSLLSSPECLKLARTSLTRTHNNTPARTHTHTQLFIAHYYNSDLFVWFLNCLCYTSYMLCAVHRRLGTVWGGILFYIHWFEEKKNHNNTKWYTTDCYLGKYWENRFLCLMSIDTESRYWITILYLSRANIKEPCLVLDRVFVGYSLAPGKPAAL